MSVQSFVEALRESVTKAKRLQGHLKEMEKVAAEKRRAAIEAKEKEASRR